MTAPRGRFPAAALGLVMTLVVGSATPALGQPRSNEPPSFNESGACDDPAGILAPMADVDDPNSYRGLPSTAEVRGPWADFFGRDLGDVQASLVLWKVPMSGGQQVWIHKRALPAFKEAKRLLAIEQSKGHYYPVRIVGTFSWRRVGGSFRMSHHSFGTTIDINWDTNPQLGSGPPPQRSEYTDIPKWFVRAWRDAGFCWGGDWQSNKDPMHFSWKGPAATPGYGSQPKPFARNTSLANFTEPDSTFNPGFGPDTPEDAYLVADASRDGAADIIRVRPIGKGALAVDIAYAGLNYKRCGIEQIRTAPTPFESEDVGMANLTGDARADIWVLGFTDGLATVAYSDPTTSFFKWKKVTTGAHRSWTSSINFADFDNDGKLDLYVLKRREADVRLRIFSGKSDWSTKIKTATVPLSPAKFPFIEIADRGGDGIPDLIGASGDSTIVKYATGSSGYQQIRLSPSNLPSTMTSAQFADWDGDGRDDLYALGAKGSGDIYSGGSGITKSRFWFLPNGWGCTPVTYPAAPYDFNGDSFADIIAAAPYEDLGSTLDAGAVYVTPGGVDLHSGTGGMWSQATTGLKGNAERLDHYGKAFASGDFNGDGRADLAVGVPREKSAGLEAAGVVAVIFGSPTGLTVNGDQVWSQDSPKVNGESEPHDRFGAALATGDFNGDGREDLIVGSPGERLDGMAKAGMVSVFYGDRWDGLVPGDRITQDTAGVPGTVESGDQFGSTLVTADFNGDGYDDAAIGSPTETASGRAKGGVVHIVYGGDGGLNPATTVSFKANDAFNESALQKGGRFAASLAADDIDGDGLADLAVGSPGFDGSGAVIVLRGRPGGLANAGWPLLTQGVSALGGKADPGDSLGASLACADLNGDGFAEVVMGIPGKDVGSASDAGMVRIAPGSGTGPELESAIAISQSRTTIWGQPETGDSFGASIVVSDLDHDGAFDLTIGAPGEEVQGLAETGLIVIVPGRIGGLVAFYRSQGYYQGKVLTGVLEPGDRTGS